MQETSAIEEAPQKINNGLHTLQARIGPEPLVRFCVLVIMHSRYVYNMYVCFVFLFFLRLYPKLTF